MKTQLAILSMALFGCSSLNPFSDSPSEVAAKEHRAKMVAPTCPAEHGESQCGLISTATDYEDFVKATCGGKRSKECQTQFIDQTMARMRLRYPATDWGYVSTWCTGYPAECSKPDVMEGEILASHNSAIEASLNERQRAIAEDGANRRRAAWAAFAEGLKQQNQNNVSCTSRQMGATTYTDCN